MKRLLALLVLLPGLAWGQGLPIKDGNSGTLMEVNANGAGMINEGPSSRRTYIASSSALVTTALYSLAIEAGASQGFKLSSFCVGVTNATAAAGVTVSVNRTTAASSGGTALTAEGTGADSISKMDPADASWPGVARRTGTLTLGITLDQMSFQVGELGAGAADPAGNPIFCRQYGLNGEKMPTIAAGTANGIAIRVSSLGAGGLAFGSISATLIAD